MKDDRFETEDGAPAGREKQKNLRKRMGFTLLALFLLAGAFLAGWFGRYGAIDPRMRRLMWALDTIKDNYYEEPDLDGIYDDLFAALTPDDYSRYYSKTEYDAVLRESDGQNTGIGVTLLSGADDSVRLYRVRGNSPADLAGLQWGMYVYGYGNDAESLRTGGAAELLDFLNSSTGDVCLRCGYDEASAKNFTVRRASYAATYCHYRDSEAAYAFRGENGLVLVDVTESYGTLTGADDKTAYIRIDSFTANVAEEFRRCLVKMKERGRTDLVLDLRMNGGGYMDRLTAIASHLMKTAPKRAIVATARYRGGKSEDFLAFGCDYASYFAEGSRVKVLADENTASASEALIGAMLDYGTIGYGDIFLRESSGKTYGKGIMQSSFTDSKGNVMKLTVATIHWPLTNVCIQERGIRVQDGAIAVDAPLIWGKDDTMLAFALS